MRPPNATLPLAHPPAHAPAHRIGSIFRVNLGQISTLRAAVVSGGGPWRRTINRPVEMPTVPACGWRQAMSDVEDRAPGLDSGRCKLAVPVAHPPIHRSPINPFHFPLRCAFGRARCTNKPVAASAVQPTRDSGRQGKQTVMWQPNTVPQAMTVSHDVRMAGTTAEPPPPDGGGSAKRKRDAIAEMHVTVDKKKAGRKSNARCVGFFCRVRLFSARPLSPTHTSPCPNGPEASMHAIACHAGLLRRHRPHPSPTRSLCHTTPALQLWGLSLAAHDNVTRYGFL